MILTLFQWNTGTRVRPRSNPQRRHGWSFGRKARVFKVALPSAVKYADHGMSALFSGKDPFTAAKIVPNQMASTFV
jgi:hypothetical protein